MIELLQRVMDSLRDACVCHVLHLHLGDQAPQCSYCELADEVNEQIQWLESDVEEARAQ